MKTTITLIAVFVLCVLGEAAQVEYKVIDLGTFGGYSWAYGINSSGQVVGSSTNADNQERPFLWSNGSMQNLGTLGGRSVAYAINNFGQVVGNSVVTEGNHAVSRAFLWSNGSMQNIVTSGTASSVRDINNHEQVVGTIFFTFTSSLDFHGFIYSKGVMQDLGTLGGSYSAAYGINDIGQVIGVSSDINNQQHPFLWSNGSMQDLGTLRGNNVNTPYAINNLGQIVGVSGNMGSEVWSAFLYSDGSMQDLGTLGGSYSFAYGINNLGQVVGYSTSDINPSTQLDSAFLWENGSIRDLNSLIDPASGWQLRRAYAINDLGQIVGYGDHPLGGLRAFLLNPVFLDAKKVIEVKQEQPTYGNFPVKEEGRDSLVLITHGWIGPTQSANSSIAWVNSMSNSIIQYLSDNNFVNWQVYGCKWTEKADTGLLGAQKALENAKQEGKILGDHIASQGWTHVHLIAHSAGAGLIQAVLERIKAISPSTTVHCTFLDPFVGFDYAGVSQYGKGADWAENYFTRDSETIGAGPVTESLLDHSYNVDVTPLDPNKTVGAKFYSSATGEFEPCVKTWTHHDWPISFYMNTITGDGVTSDYAGFGFLLGKEGGNWDLSLASYTPGNDPALVLGMPDPICSLQVQVKPPAWANTLPDFTQLPAVQSDTGTIQKWLDSLKLSSGSPAWLVTAVSSTNPINIVSFDAQFESVEGAQGLLSVLWDDQVIGLIDERTISTNRHTFKFPNAAASSSHILGFRLDPFTNIQSVVVVTNVVFGQAGISQPFSLSVTGDMKNGTPVYQLEGEAGFEYLVQASTNLIDWVDVITLVNTNGAVRFFDQDSANSPTMFYRAVAPY